MRRFESDESVQVEDRDLCYRKDEDTDWFEEGSKFIWPSRKLPIDATFDKATRKKFPMLDPNKPWAKVRIWFFVSNSQDDSGFMWARQTTIPLSDFAGAEARARAFFDQVAGELAEKPYLSLRSMFAWTAYTLSQKMPTRPAKG